jgi:predicted AAA+ superfamily ATPase
VALYANYWRDKRRHEIDFVLPDKKNKPVTIECKWRSSDFDPSGFKAFRRYYSAGKNFVVAQDIDFSYKRNCGVIEITFVKITFVNLQGLFKQLADAGFPYL